MATIGAKIKKLREIRGYSQSYMASKLHVSQEQYSYLENRQRNISEKNIKTVLVLLNVSKEYFGNFDTDQLIQDSSQKEKLTMKGCMGESNMPERAAYLELISS